VPRLEPIWKLAERVALPALGGELEQKVEQQLAEKAEMSVRQEPAEKA
jgi:hypothetical protein